MNKIILECKENSVRIDKYITIDGMTRASVQKMIESGSITVNGNPTKNNYKLRIGDIIEINKVEPKEADILPEDIPLDIVFEDDSLLVINKPQDMVVHPAPGNYTGTLVNALMYHCKNNLSGINGVLRPGIVHRIDKDTSGLLLVAKTNEAHLSLSAQIQQKTVKREYVAICHGCIKPLNGVIDAPIGRDTSNRLRMAVTPVNSKHAVTHFNVIEYLNESTLVKCVLETGRTHQIRVHMKYIGHPVLGDPLYAKSNPYNLAGQALHARVIGFDHPITGQRMEFEQSPPESFVNLWEKLKENNLK